MPLPEIDLSTSQHEVEIIVREIVSSIYEQAGKAGSPETESLILARVAKKLLESIVIERQAEVTKKILLQR